MSSFFLAKRIFSSSSPLYHHHFHRLVLPTPLLRHSLSTQSQQPKEHTFIGQYLISSFGFSPDRALKYFASSLLAAIKSSDQPQSVVTFLKDTGLSHDHIQAVVSFYPLILGYNVENTLKPKVGQLMDAGFSGELLVPFIRYNPGALARKDTLSHLQFWRDFAGNDNQILLKILNKQGLLIMYDINKYVVPRINLYKEYGISNRDIVGMLASGYRCMSKSLDSYKQILEFIEEAGIPRESGMFLLAFRLLASFSKDTIERKVGFCETNFGWSQEEVYSAFKKWPPLLATSEDKVKSNMDFLIRKAELKPENIAARPILLGFSLQKRLVPRHHVLSILATKGLKKNLNLSRAYTVTEKRFFEKYIEPYKKDAPELAEAYLAACGGNIPV